jgi:hypothetical protein
MDSTIKEQLQAFVTPQHTFHIDAFDLQEITQLVYGKEIEMLESPNDTTHEYTAQAGALEAYDQKALDEAIECGSLECWQYRVILNDLCNKGYLTAGEYFIRMSW